MTICHPTGFDVFKPDVSLRTSPAIVILIVIVDLHAFLSFCANWGCKTEAKMMVNRKAKWEGKYRAASNSINRCVCDLIVFHPTGTCRYIISENGTTPIWNMFSCLPNTWTGTACTHTHLAVRTAETFYSPKSHSSYRCKLPCPLKTHHTLCQSHPPKNADEAVFTVVSKQLYNMGSIKPHDFFPMFCSLTWPRH